MSRNRNKRKPMSDINVVPYIDVMLVLLIIFMVTAPMLMQGVKVELPEASADPVEKQDSEPVIVSVDAGRPAVPQSRARRSRFCPWPLSRIGSLPCCAAAPTSRC